MGIGAVGQLGELVEGNAKLGQGRGTDSVTTPHQALVANRVMCKTVLVASHVTAA